MRFWRITILLAIFAVAGWVGTFLANCFNDPQFPGESSIAVMGFILMIVSFINLLITLVSHWRKHNEP